MIDHLHFALEHGEPAACRILIAVINKVIQGLELPDDCEVIIPPAVCSGFGADGLAMIMQIGLLNETKTALITSYGTNAEMALYLQGRIITASAAAGPALEGQQIPSGIVLRILTCEILELS